MVGGRFPSHTRTQPSATPFREHPDPETSSTNTGRGTFKRRQSSNVGKGPRRCDGKDSVTAGTEVP